MGIPTVATVLIHACRCINSGAGNSTTLRLSILCGLQNADCETSTTYNLRNIRCRKKLSEFSILCSVTKVVICYLLNKHVATFTVVLYCQQIAEHSAPVIPQSICGWIPHSVFRIPQSILTPHWWLWFNIGIGKTLVSEQPFVWSCLFSISKSSKDIELKLSIAVSPMAWLTHWATQHTDVGFAKRSPCTIVQWEQSTKQYYSLPVITVVMA